MNGNAGAAKWVFAAAVGFLVYKNLVLTNLVAKSGAELEDMMQFLVEPQEPREYRNVDDHGGNDEEFIVGNDIEIQGEEDDNMNINNSRKSANLPLGKTADNQAANIRKWGCHRKETPLIFVHVGKAGGGEIRRLLALSAKNYGRQQKWGNGRLDNHYYPIRDGDGDGDNSFRKGKFCNHQNPNAILIPKNNRTTSVFTSHMDGLILCNATTPFGMAIACSNGYRTQSSFKRNKRYKTTLCEGCDDDYYLEIKYFKNTSESDRAAAAEKIINPPPAGHTCDTVYTSHNNLGNEMSWLPPRYLKEHWWDNSPWKNKASNMDIDELEPYWLSLLYDRERRRHLVLDAMMMTMTNTTKQNLVVNAVNATKYRDQRNKTWCPAGYEPTTSLRGTFYDRSPVPVKKHELNIYTKCGKPIAENADRIFKRMMNGATNFAPIYASMPLHRVTMLRDPWSWIISYYFWHTKIKNWAGIKCDNITGKKKVDMHENIGWIESSSYRYLFFLCGNDCITRYENNIITLPEIEAQAEDNLRNSFSVVGILHESDSFYEMIHKRIDYVSLRNTTITGGRHSTAKKNSKEQERCKDLFLKNETFREMVRKTLPVFAALERVYYVGVEVNRFQKEELSQCDQ